MDALWSPAERLAVAERMALMVVGGPGRVAANLAEIVRVTQADELIIASDAYERADRLRSYEIIAQSFR
jgi:alkanesulfonate monooxygenase SsuD/methylene tetrahydromethanopterin reductase-like flavin-dependent oxidoreductase (luciferase family)